MAARHDPGFIGDARRIGTEGRIVSANFNDAQALTLLLRQYVAKNAAFFALVIIARGSEFVEHASRYESGRSELESRMVELLPCSLAVIFENADVFEAAVAFQILKPLRGQTQKLFDFGITRIPQVTVMTWIFEQNFMSPDGSHTVVESVTAPRRLPFNMVERLWMDNRTCRPRAAIHTRQIGNHLGCIG